MGIPVPDSDTHHPYTLLTIRTGTVWTAVAHIITGVIGSGVLSLAWSVAQLGWIAGPVSMLFFAMVTAISTFLTCNSYRSPDPEHGLMRNTTLFEAVRSNLGEKKAWICGLLIQIVYYGSGVAYVITSALCFRAIEKSNCYHKKGHDAPCEFSNKRYMLLFGLLQIFMSQIPDLHSMEWLSMVAAAMSFTYSSIGFGLGAAKVIGDGVIQGDIHGVSAPTGIQKMWLVFQAIGDIAFAYPFSSIILNIQDTLKSPPSESATMKRASMISIVITTFLYLGCGGFGYAAFGDHTPGNLLTGFGFYEPYWLIDLANACIVLHLIGGYQLYSQPIFAAIDKWLIQQYPDSTFVKRQYTVKLPLLPAVKLNLQRLCSRTAYVASTTAVGIIFPYFNEVLGVIGAISFWPLSIYFPVEMCLRQKSIEAWTRKWIVLRGFSIGTFVIAVLAFVGSVEGLIAARFSSAK